MNRENKARRVVIEIQDFGTINVNLTRMYDKGHLKRLSDYLSFAFEEWEKSVVMIENLQ